MGLNTYCLQYTVITNIGSLISDLFSGNLNLKLTKQETDLHVAISDNGIGRKKSAELKTNNQKKNRSTALRNIKERIQIVNELHDLKINVTIKDFHKDGTGTIVELVVPQNRFKK